MSPLTAETATPAPDWTVQRCPGCGTWEDVTSPTFEHYGCVTCSLLADPEASIVGPCQDRR